MTDPQNQEQLERIARLQARRSSTNGASQPFDRAPGPTNRNNPRRHPALGSRIAAAGLGATSMFAIVGILGLRDRSAADAVNTQPITAPEAVERPITIVVHHIPAPTTPTSNQDTPPASTAPASPIELTANTVVRTVTVTEAPRRTTSGGSGGAAARTSGSK